MTSADHFFLFFSLETSFERNFLFLKGSSSLFTTADGAQHLDAVVLGAAGSGKTTAFTRRLPYGWAKGELFQEVELLFIITVRNSKEASLESLLGLRRKGLKEQERKDVKEFLETNNDPHKILIVVDGRLHKGHTPLLHKEQENVAFLLIGWQQVHLLPACLFPV